MPATAISRTSPTSRRYSAAAHVEDHMNQADKIANVLNVAALTSRHRTPAIASQLRSWFIGCINMMLYPMLSRNEQTTASRAGYGKPRIYVEADTAMRAHCAGERCSCSCDDNGAR